ncbi:MAG TPA: hypothetical protein VIK99_01620 [Thermaerobacter sp.]
MSEWNWVRREARARVNESYVKVGNSGLYLSMVRGDMPWPRESTCVEVGFRPGAIAIRRAESGYRLVYQHRRTRWAASIPDRELASIAEQYGIPAGAMLVARWDPASDMVIARLEQAKAQDGHGAASRMAG